MILRHLDILLFDMFHADFFQMRTEIHILVGVSGSVGSMVSRISPRKLDILPHLCAEFFHRGVEHEESAVEFEESHDSIRCCDCKTQCPRKPIHILLICRIRLDTEKRRNCKAPNCHCHTQSIE